MKFGVLLPLAASAFCIVSCAGTPRYAAFLDPLEHELKARRIAGVTDLRSRIAELVEREALPDIYAPNPGAAMAASAGRLKVASAAWWGWNAESATFALNAALSAPVDILIIPAMQKPWVVGPLFISGPKTVLFEPGCVMLAAKGEFLDRNDSLISVVDEYGLTISGYGSRLVMRKSDYTRDPYVPSQWRHAISILESGGLLIEGLSIERSGGDGVYIGQRRGGSRPMNITLRDLDLKGNHRQGVSVIAAYGFLMEYCRVVGTRGNPPQAGIDFEPNSQVYGLVDCVVRSCVFRRNAGAAVHVHLSKVKATQPPVSITVEDSVLIGAPLALWVRGLSSRVRGSATISGGIVKGLKTVERTPFFSVDY